MKYLIFAILLLTVFSFLFLNIRSFKKAAIQQPQYSKYLMNAEKDTMVELPSGIVINIDMTRKEAMELIYNPRSGLGVYAAEIIKYFDNIEEAKK